MKKELTKVFRDTLNTNSHLRHVLACMAEKLNMSENDILAGYVRYDSEIGEYDNSVYDDMGLRAALYLKYFVPGSYHVERQQILTNLLRNCGRVKNIVDIGYGAPGLYVSDFVLARRTVRLSLLDTSDNAKFFSRALLECAYPDTNWTAHIDLQTYDLNTHASPGKFDVYILFDAIEHAQDPSLSMDSLVSGSSPRAQFLLSLPICSKEGIERVHFIEWLTEDDALSWLRERKLEVVEQKKVFPTGVDIWARNAGFYNLIVRCIKS